ncbi:MAG TPA: ABC transporter permease [Terriglobia bacterium]|nr:ABC transporter permease [Terriglobia bacterium]
MPLLRKELRALIPFIGLVFFICAISVADEMIDHWPDMRPLSLTINTLVAPGPGYSVPLFLLVFALGSGLLVREQDEGTIEFIDSLPVSRSRVFWTKFLLASLVFCLIPISNLAIAVALHGLSRTSIDPSFHWQALLISFFLAVCQSTFFLALALLLSFLRRFSWLMVVLLVWAYLLVERFHPGVAVFNPLALTMPHFAGQHWILPTDLLKAQMPLAAVMLIGAWFLFAGAGDRIGQAYRKLSLSRAGLAVMAGAAVLTVVLGFVTAYYLIRQDPASADESADSRKVARAVYASWTTAHASSTYYSFVYPANLSDRARAVIAHADEVHEKVRTFLGASAEGGRIAVDMTGSVPRHAGVAYWNTIRLDLAAFDDVDLLLGILGHETVHVYVNRLSDSRVENAFDSTRFFNEGLATYLEYRLFGSSERVRQSRSVAAVMRQRREVEFRELVNNGLLRRNRDLNVVYPLGEVFVAALVDRFGDDAPGTLLRTLARKERPSGLQGMELWRDTFQAAGFSLEVAIDAFFSRLDVLANEYRAFASSLPRPRGAVHYEFGEIGVEPQWAPMEGWDIVCRFRQSADSEEREYLNSASDDFGVFRVDSALLPGATFWFQIGIRELGTGRTIWEPWREIRNTR